MKTVRVILSKDAEEAYTYLNEQAPSSKIERTILNAVKKKVDLIKTNPHYGEPISKKMIPRKYIEQYGVNNLFWVELPNFWRMLYTLTEGDSVVEIIAFVVDICDHKEYDKIFGYRKK
jgi:hypothetical protein